MTHHQAPDMTAPGIFDWDLKALGWAAQFTTVPVRTVDELLAGSKVPVFDAATKYASLTGRASANSHHLLAIIARQSDMLRAIYAENPDLMARLGYVPQSVLDAQAE